MSIVTPDHINRAPEPQILVSKKKKNCKMQCLEKDSKFGEQHCRGFAVDMACCVAAPVRAIYLCIIQLRR